MSRIAPVLDWLDEHWPPLILAGLFVLMVVLGIREENEWRRFAASHRCVVVGESSGSTGTGLGMSSGGNAVVVTTYTPGKTGYRCDDGVTYWR